MEGEARVLQQRVEVLPVRRRGREACERVGGEEGEADEGADHHGLDPQHARAERRRQVPVQHRHQTAEDRQGDDPEQHGALMVPPHAGDPIDQRQGGVAVLEHVLDAEVRGDVRPGQRAEGERGQGGQGHRRRPGDRYGVGVAAVAAPEARPCLDQGHQEGQHQGVVAQFDNHALRSAPRPF